MISSLLKKFGFSDKEIKVYLACIKLGPSPVRRIATETGINRGTTYDILKSLMDNGLVSYYQKEKNQYFVAEDPEKLRDLLESKKNSLSKIDEQLNRVIPELKSMYNNAGEKPVTKLYEGDHGVAHILKDVLQEMKRSEKKEYLVFSSANIREYLYRKYPNFTKDRIQNKIEVKVIAIGSGGEDQPFSARKWLDSVHDFPSYIIIYGAKTAFISVDSEKQPIGVIIEDEGITQTQRVVFQFMWERLN